MPRRPLWHHWDTHHYLFIAENGYPASGGREQVIVFYPLYPLLVRMDRDEDTSLRAVGALLIFPTAYFLHGGYAKNLFLALTLGSFLQARRGRWGWACVLGALSVLTRLLGIALAPALLLEYLHQTRAAPTSRKVPSAGLRVSRAGAGGSSGLSGNERVRSR